MNAEGRRGMNAEGKVVLAEEEIERAMVAYFRERHPLFVSTDPEKVARVKETMTGAAFLAGVSFAGAALAAAQEGK